MIQPTDNVWKALAITVRQYPELHHWIRDWQVSELDRLPYAGQNSAVQSGRCQVLMELVKLLNNAPDTAAKR